MNSGINSKTEKNIPVLLDGILYTDNGDRNGSDSACYLRILQLQRCDYGGQGVCIPGGL